VRALYPESVPRVLVSDTVGFIKNLPHGLVASFKSTLDEALDAALLLHVIDASDPGFVRQLEVTEEVLAEIGADAPENKIPRIKVFNKIDFVGDEIAQAECEAALKAKYPDCIVMSARRPDEVAKLHQIIVAFFQQDLIEEELFLPWTAQQHRGEIYANCQVLEEHSDENGAYFRVRGEASHVKKLQDKIN
jgi:GTP-binding protein HflX